MIARIVRPIDEVTAFYCPAAFEEPKSQFPCIERLGPLSSTFSGFDSDPVKPLCLIMGVGFEAGVSMGIISQLEPRLSYCLWGSGVSAEFDAAVKRANFDYEFAGFNTRVASYRITDPVGTYQLFESLAYRLTNDYRVVIIPMGPKLFTLQAILVGMTYFGKLAVWRVQHSRVAPPDAVPNNYCVWARLDTSLMAQFATNEREIFK